jgi:hypothetical protein
LRTSYARLRPNKALQLTAKGRAAIDLWYPLAPNSGAPASLGWRPLPAAERLIRWAARDETMTLFEYLAIAFSLVFAFAATRILSGLSHAMDPARRYWVHLIAVFGWLSATIAVFWAFWSFRGVDWTLPKFLLALASPGLIFFNACTIIPDDPSTVASWRDYYYSVRRRYFLGMLAWAIVIVVVGTVVLGMPWSHPARAVQGAFAIGGIAGATSSNERVHYIITLSLVVVIAIGMILIGSRPSPLVP